MDIFGDVAPGTVGFADSSGAAGALAFSSSLTVGDMLITGVGYSGRAAVQIMHTLGKITYYYSFGLRDEAMVISGIAFARVCQGGPQGPMQPGGPQMLQLATKFRAAARSGEVVTVDYGESYRGVVDSLRTTWVDYNIGMLGFELRIHLFDAGASAGTP